MMTEQASCFSGLVAVVEIKPLALPPTTVRHIIGAADGATSILILKQLIVAWALTALGLLGPLIYKCVLITSFKASLLVEYLSSVFAVVFLSVFPQSWSMAELIFSVFLFEMVRVQNPSAPLLFEDSLSVFLIPKRRHSVIMGDMFQVMKPAVLPFGHSNIIHEAI